jgi:serine/threonine protein phosphatase PrpC
MIQPSLPSETLRIQAAGGVVSNDRVHGSLGCSRSWGDIQFKGFNGKPRPVGGEMAEGGIWHNAQVFSKPDVTHFYVHPDVEFMIMASDGLWDVFPNQQVCICCSPHCSESKQECNACSSLRSESCASCVSAKYAEM